MATKPSPRDIGRKLNSAEKKRARDRRAQQALRDKRTRHIQALEDKVNLCQKLHDTVYINQILNQCRVLRDENKTLRDRQAQLQALLKSWGTISCEPCHDLLGDAQDIHLEDASRLPETHRQTLDGDDGLEIAIEPTTSESVNYSSAFNFGNTDDSSLLDTFVIGDGIPSWVTESLTATSRTVPPCELGPFDLGFVSAKQPALGDVREAVDASMPELSLYLSPNRFSSQNLVSMGEGMEIFDTIDYSAAHAIEPLRSPSSQIVSNACLNGIPVRNPETIENLRLDSPGSELFTNNVPPWACVPLAVLSPHLTSRFSPWDANISHIVQAPDVPSAKELLYGSRNNTFARTISHCLQTWPCRQPERLAIGFLVYFFVKWRVNPTVETFARLPDFYTPTLEQLQLPHHGFLDMIVWKRIRSDLIRHQNKYSYTEVLELFCSSLKVRWPQGQDILELNDKDELVVNEKFFRQFMCEDGWGLSLKFINMYPHLVEGLPLDKIVYEEECSDIYPCI